MSKTQILLHACCGPCSPYIISSLSVEYDVSVCFFNPNIFPQEELVHREMEIRKYCDAEGIAVFVPEYSHEDWLVAIKGNEDCKEGGERCRICFRYRLEKTARVASENGIPLFTTTLTVSPHKNAQVINETGIAAGEMHGVKFLKSDFKKKDGFKKSCEAATDHGMYRQNYCGCKFSMR